MQHATASPHPGRATLALFAEDFDRPTGIIVLDELDAGEPEPAAAPLITAAALEAAGAAAFAEGRCQGLAQAAAEREAQVQCLLATLVEQMRAADAERQRYVDETGELVVQLMFDHLRAIFPSLCKRFGGAEIARFTQQVVTVLNDEQRTAIHVHPTMVPDVERALEPLDPDHRARIFIEPRDSMQPGDARITWRAALAKRDAHAMWAQVNETMAQLGLSAPVGPSGPAGPNATAGISGAELPAELRVYTTARPGRHHATAGEHDG